jgi:putative Holliday junction resolvase
MHDEVPRQGRLGGIDYGSVRIGVAICDARQIVASPYENYQRRGDFQDRGYFAKLAAEESLVGWVVGLPIHLSGKESEKSQEARKFADWLQSMTQLPVAFMDERFSSAFAEELLGPQAGLTSKQRKKRRDMVAAQIILAGYLESNRNQKKQGNQSIEDRD